MKAIILHTFGVQVGGFLDTRRSYEMPSGALRGGGWMVIASVRFRFYKGTLLGTPNREPQEYSRSIIGIYLPGSSYSTKFLLYSWGSLFGVPIRVPLALGFRVQDLELRVGGVGFRITGLCFMTQAECQKRKRNLTNQS